MLQIDLKEEQYRWKVLDGRTLNYFSGSYKCPKWLRAWPLLNAGVGSLQCLHMVLGSHQHYPAPP